MSRPGWWRENRFWLPALPLALVAMLAASAYHVEDHWYAQGLHHELASASAGDFVRVTDEYDDYLGPTSRTFRVRLDELVTLDRFPSETGPSEPPPGTRVIAAHLDWAAEPDQVMLGCSVALVDSQGRRYQVLGWAKVGDPCVPESQEGPSAPVTEGQERGEILWGEHRPPEWSTEPAFLVAEDAEITQVLVWWNLPDYVELSGS